MNQKQRDKIDIILGKFFGVLGQQEHAGDWKGCKKTREKTITEIGEVFERKVKDEKGS